jgi:hypothetical protein
MDTNNAMQSARFSWHSARTCLRFFFLINGKDPHPHPQQAAGAGTAFYFLAMAINHGRRQHKNNSG